MAKRILLIYPPIYEFALYDLFLKPYGLLRFARWFEEAGWEVTIINALDYLDSDSTSIIGKPYRKNNGTGKFHRMPASELVHTPQMPQDIESFGRRFCRYGILQETLKRKISEFGKPDLILISSGMTYWYMGAKEATEFCKEIYPQTPIFIGGVYATLMPDHCKRYCEPDEVIIGDNLSDFIKAASKYIPIENLPKNLFPEFPLIHPDIFKDAAVVRLNYGCYMNCDYCASRLICKEFKKGDPVAAFNFVKDIYEKLGTVNFAFYDDALLAHKDEVLIPFLNYIKKSQIPIKFFCPNAMHIQLLDEPTAILMKEAGFQEIRLGFESVSTDFHKKHDQKYSMQKFISTMTALKNAGFEGNNVKLYTLAGLPHQDYREVEAALELAQKLSVRVSIAEYSPVPGTALWQDCLKFSRFDLLNEPVYHNNTFFPMEWEGFTREDLERMKTHSRVSLTTQ